MSSTGAEGKPIPLPLTSAWESEWVHFRHASFGWNFGVFGTALVVAGLILDDERQTGPSFGGLRSYSISKPPFTAGDVVHWVLCVVFVRVAVGYARERRRRTGDLAVRVLRGAWTSCMAMAGAQTALAVAAVLLAAGALGLGARDVPGTSAVFSSEGRVAATFAFLFAVLVARERVLARRRFAPGGCAMALVATSPLMGLAVGGVLAVVLINVLGRGR